MQSLARARAPTSTAGVAPRTLADWYEHLANEGYVVVQHTYYRDREGEPGLPYYQCFVIARSGQTVRGIVHTWVRIVPEEQEDREVSYPYDRPTSVSYFTWLRTERELYNRGFHIEQVCEYPEPE